MTPPLGITWQSQKIMSDFQVRKSKKQKEAFRQWLCGELERAGYTPQVEKGFTAKNVVVGDPEKAKVIFSAHYDTCAVLPIPNFITPRNGFFYLCYQMLLVLGMFVSVAAMEVLLALLLDALHVEKSILIAMPVGYVLCLFFCWWILDGPANQHTANDNTSGVITLLETALGLPESSRASVCFVFFDNEEKGLFGSAAFTKAHKKAKKETLNINFDCVSDGDFIQFFPNDRMKKKDPATLEMIEAAFRGRGGKSVEVVRGFGFYPSDNRAFKRGVGVCALKRKKFIGYYMDRIHTSKDTVLEEENILQLRRGALNLANYIHITSKLKEESTHAR